MAAKLNNKLKSTIKYSIFGSLWFFLITNFGVWASGSMYPKNIFGILACYTAAIPFYYSTLFGSLFYSFFLFGTYEFYALKLKTLKV